MTQNKSSSGRLAVVTGAASSIGRAIAAHFLEEGLRGSMGVEFTSR
jgi:NAD(P)-dependent dehydrogenase (short-subunit alcohol dehydrogenase family)